MKLKMIGMWILQLTIQFDYASWGDGTIQEWFSIVIFFSNQYSL